MESDALLEDLNALPTPPLDAALAERVRLRARAALTAPTRRGPGRRALDLATPLLVTGATAGYLVWAARVLVDLSR